MTTTCQKRVVVKFKHAACKHVALSVYSCGKHTYALASANECKVETHHLTETLLKGVQGKQMHDSVGEGYTHHL